MLKIETSRGNTYIKSESVTFVSDIRNSPRIDNLDGGYWVNAIINRQPITLEFLSKEQANIAIDRINNYEFFGV